MLPEQIPGTLFVLLLAAVGLQTGQYDAVMLSALGCAFGWQTFSHNYRVAFVAQLGAVACWALAFVLTAWRLL